MQKFRRGLTIVLIIWGIVVLLGCSSDGPAHAAVNNSPRSLWQTLTHAPQKLTVPEGTTLVVRLEETLRSNHCRGGEAFVARLMEPVAVGKKVAIPQGARITGQVVEATPSGRFGFPAALALALTNVEVDGSSYDLSTSTVGRRASASKQRLDAQRGSGAESDGLLATLLANGKHAANRQGMRPPDNGAGASSTAGQDVVLSAESLLRFRLEAPVTIIQ